MSLLAGEPLTVYHLFGFALISRWSADVPSSKVMFSKEKAEPGMKL
ncbi:hypothetical protein [Thermococcus waiotapuensis]|uniref:Uncharacterized protein n=1 Tax=Thermococcus waiotapuensis TaxID=90909 RepID=A0AAE4NV17_9EURY|nr:hypothetical protein [Thermococcus waiotapuensis]MDV3103639.1 hypothetical protein [Thermococcus waiotapuensis]